MAASITQQQETTVTVTINNQTDNVDDVHIADGRLSYCALYLRVALDLMMDSMKSNLFVGPLFIIFSLITGIFTVPPYLLYVFVSSKYWSLHLTHAAIHYHPPVSDCFGKDTKTIPLSYIHSIYAKDSTVCVELPRDKYIDIVYPFGGVPEYFGTYTTGFCCTATRHRCDTMTYKLKYVANPQEFVDAVDAVITQMNTMKCQVETVTTQSASVQ